jgi:hypothetical protein
VSLEVSPLASLYGIEYDIEKGPLREVSMDTLVEQLDAKFRVWQPEMANQVRQRIAEIIEMADRDALDVLRSRAVEQEVLDALDEPATR